MPRSRTTRRPESDRAHGVKASEPRPRGAGRRHAAPPGELTDVDREIVEALAGFRDTLRDRVPLESRYTVRQVDAVEPPPSLAPADVREIRESLGFSQPLFADLLGISPSTVRSWEQGQKPPSAMARRFLGLISADRPYWKRRFGAMIRSRDDGARGRIG